MDLAVAGRVEQHPIVWCVTTAMRAPHHMMVVPSRHCGDRFTAVWAAPMLAFPEGKDGHASFEGGRHLETQTFLKVELPLGIVGVDRIVDLDMSLNGETMRRKKVDRLGLSLWATHLAGKYPAVLINAMKVACLHPPYALIGMSPFGPSPQRLKDGVVHGLEYFRADSMAVIHRPTPNDRVQVADEVASRGALVALNPTTPLSLALRFSALTMREIGLVIAPLDPRHKSEALFNRIGMQGQHDVEEPTQLRHRECWRFFPPDALASAREKKGPAS